MGAEFYTDKEKLILQGVVDLLLEGVSFHQMKVADIAFKAGIGKGTIYEYFASKEEIISESIVYNIGQELAGFRRIIDESENFRDCTSCILLRIIQCHERFVSPFLLMGSEMTGIKEVEKLFHSRVDIFQTNVHEGIKKYLALGVKEGLFAAEKVSQLGVQTVLGSLAGFQMLLHNENEENSQLMANTYEIIVKSLQ